MVYNQSTEGELKVVGRGTSRLWGRFRRQWVSLATNRGASQTIIFPFSAILITGGWEADRLKSAEIYLPSGNTSCSLPELPEWRRGHTQDGPWACGGGKYISTDTSCDHWSEGSWTHISLRELRWGHVSLATASGLYLMGGEWSLQTSELVKEDGSVEEGFELKYKIR